MEEKNYYHKQTDEERDIRELRYQYYHTVNNWYLWAELDQFLCDHPDIYKKADVFFAETLRSLLTTVILGLCRLFDKDTRTLSFYCFEDDLKAYRQTIKHEELQTIQKAYKVLDEIRDQHISHHDKDRKQVNLMSNNINIVKDYAFDFLNYLEKKYLNEDEFMYFIPPKGMVEMRKLIESMR